MKSKPKRKEECTCQVTHNIVDDGELCRGCGKIITVHELAQPKTSECDCAEKSSNRYTGVHQVCDKCQGTNVKDKPQPTERTLSLEGIIEKCVWEIHDGCEYKKHEFKDSPADCCYKHTAQAIRDFLRSELGAMKRVKGVNIGWSEEFDEGWNEAIRQTKLALGIDNKVA